MLSFLYMMKSSEKSSNSSNPRGDLLLDSIQTPYSSTSAFGQILWSHLDRSWCLPGWGWVDSEKKTHEVIILLMEDIRRTSWYGETTIYTCQVVQVLQDFFRQHYVTMIFTCPLKNMKFEKGKDHLPTIYLQRLQLVSGRVLIWYMLGPAKHWKTSGSSMNQVNRNPFANINRFATYDYRV